MTGIMNFIIQPLNYPFMQRGMLAAVLVGGVCAVVGAYVVLRGMAFFGDALAHAILPGVAVGYLVGGGAREPLFWWALATAVVSSMGIGTLIRAAKIREDTAIGIVFAGMFALGIALISTVRNYTADLAHFLFGDVLAVSNTDLLLIGVFGGAIVLLVVFFYKEFLLMRLPARALDYLLYVLIALAVVVSLQTVGVALMVAMLVTPAATAYQLTRRLPLMMLLGAILASLAGVIGLYLSYYLSVASGAAIVLTSTLFFILAWSVQALRQAWNKRKAIG
jgi:ABC-type Mn2+/Zn2+ transport system permease subunit